MTYYSSSYKVLDFLKTLQLLNEKKFLSAPTGASRDSQTCLNIWLNKMRCGFVSYMLFSLLQIAMSINTHPYSGLTNQGRLYPEALNPPAVRGLLCIAVAFARQLSSAQCLTPLLKGKIFSICAGSVFDLAVFEGLVGFFLPFTQ